MPAHLHTGLSKAVLRHVIGAFPDLWSRRIGLYWPYKRDVSLFPLANRILAAGGTVALPVMAAKGTPLQFRAWKPGDPLASGACDIPYPRDGHTVLPDVVLAALVGFDGAAYRLGYGGGGYDRTLAASEPRPRAIGVGFELMRLPTIRPLPHDIPMDVIVTEAGVFRRA